MAADIEASNLSQERKILTTSLLGKSDLSAIDLSFTKVHHRAHMHTYILMYAIFMTFAHTLLHVGKEPGVEQ